MELALLLPLLCTITLGMMEIGRGTMVSRALSTAARNGAQVAVLPTTLSNATVISRINSVLTDNNLSLSTANPPKIFVNGVLADVSTAMTNDKITVTVQINASQTSLTNFSVSLLQNMTYSGTITMMRQ
ncbi:MAG: TadE/TadG family type IV pilus assembly protein [Planctomycetota bacterium]